MAEPRSRPGEGCLVMAVDDEPSVRKLLELILSAAGFAVRVFDHPQRALDALQGGLRPDVIISDVSMPVMDGFEFCARVRALGALRAVPFLFLTALDGRAYMRQGMLLGADDYLTKPFDRHELVEAVAHRIRRFEEIRKPTAATASKGVQVRAFGAPVAERDGERLEWDSLKALELLVYLLEHPAGVSTFEVAEALWPGKTEAKASGAFHTTLYRLRKAVGGEIVRSANRRYYLHSAFALEYDVAHYRTLSMSARTSAQLGDYARAADLYRADFLLGVDSNWARETREQLHAEHLALLVAAAERADADGRYELATRFYTAITAHEPYSASAWEALANLWERRGHSAKAAEVRGRFAGLMDDF